MATVALLGHRIAYSASPAMHAAAFSALGLPHRYELEDVDPTHLPAAINSLRSPARLGANVTIPHKVAVMDLLDDVDDEARRAGAVNTIVARDGRLTGSNTDVPAIADEIERLGGATRAVVLGTGGAARATVAALATLGVTDVTLVSRSVSSHDNAIAPSDLPDALAAADLLVNATPVGTGNTDTPVPSRLLRGDLAVLDLVYRPNATRLVSEARARGAPAVAGAGVLLGQGWRSLESWLGAAVDERVRSAMAHALAHELGGALDA